MSLSVILADDERVIIRGLKKLIDWERLGLVLVGEAGKGDALLKEIEEKSPDIVITDISMPRLNGIDVLKAIRMNGLKTKVIFISAYREFSYAKDALSYGAVDYLIKPIDRNKLEQILVNTVNEIRKETMASRKDSQLQHYESVRQKQLIEDFLDQLVEEKPWTDQAELAGQLKGAFPDARFTVIAVEADHPSRHQGSWHEGERKLINYAIRNILEHMIPQEAAGWAVSSREQLYMVIRHDESFQAACLAEQFHANIVRYLKLSVTIGVGEQTALEQIGSSYRRARTNLSYKFFLGSNRLIAHIPEPPAESVPEQDRERLEKELLRTLIVSDSNGYVTSFKSWLELVRRLAWGNREYALHLAHVLLIRVAREPVKERSGELFEETRYVKELHGCETLDELGVYMLRELELLHDKMHRTGMQRDWVHMNEVKSFIEASFAEELSLETMAARFYMNPSYFSVFFKKNTGQNFKQYVTEVRMRHAVRMLTETDAMLYEIAEKVGCNNARQFSELFKKTYGVLPNDYRKNFKPE